MRNPAFIEVILPVFGQAGDVKKYSLERLLGIITKKPLYTVGLITVEGGLSLLLYLLLSGCRAV